MRLGIDFGTCNSSVAYFNGEEIIPIKEPTSLDYLVPSSLFVAANGKISVGRSAENQRRVDFSRYRGQLKRYLGETAPLRFGPTQTMTPQEAVAKVLKKLKKESEAYLQTIDRPMPQQVVITVPATYQAHRSWLMREAAAQAGFPERSVELLAEPVAAALSYARRTTMHDGEILLVYDLGGGTFDTALLEKKNGTFVFYDQTLPQGIDPCGGIDYDHLIYRDLLTRHPEVQEVLRNDYNGEAGLLTMANLQDSCIQLKHMLSDEDEAEISIPLATAPGVLYHQLTRADFERMIAASLGQTIACCRTMLQSASLPDERINRILLVGGSCRIPFVQQLLEREFHCPIWKADDLELVVCKGAALFQQEPEEKRKRPGMRVLANPWDLLSEMEP